MRAPLRLLGPLVLAVALFASLPAFTLPQPTPSPSVDTSGSLRLRLRPLPKGVRRVWLESDREGRLRYVMLRLDGEIERLRPEDFATRLDADHRDRSFLFRLLNITSPLGFAWVTLGLLGQLLFTGRMMLQWLVSEYEKRSVVPVGFWWMSLVGASMLLTYFIWRRDIVGVLGQSAGWMIYGRNLWLIYREKREARS